MDETNEKIADIQGKIKDIDDKETLSLADEQEKKKLQDQLDLLKDIKKTQEEINEANQKDRLEEETKKLQEEREQKK